MNKRPSTTTVLFADDHQIVREGLARLIDNEDDLKIIAETDNGEDAERMVLELKPDVTVLDLKMPRKDGAKAAIDILRRNPSARILILTSFSTSEEIKPALNAGVLGAIVKDASSEVLIDAIRAVARGERRVSPEIDDALTAAEPMVSLSDRQKEILQLVAKGFNNDEIAERIGISRGGVKAHLSIIFSRLGATSRTEAAALGISTGLIVP